jgi:hypothetical protein
LKKKPAIPSTILAAEAEEKAKALKIATDL